MAKKKTKSNIFENINWNKVIIIILIIVFLGYLLKGQPSFEKLTTKFVCKQQAYEDKESYSDIVSGKNCDSSIGCRCLHKSYLGLGHCDSCSCTKKRTVTKYKDVCIKLKKWQSPNYNDNWLNYPEIYDKNGNGI